MKDYTIVYFKAIERGFSVPSVFAEFSIFGLHFSIKWYGVIIAFGFLLAVLLGGRGAYKWKMSLDKMIDVLIYGTALAILSARLYYVIGNWSYYKNDLSSIFNVWEGGLAIYGGLIGGLIAGYIVCRVEKLNFRNLLDLSALSFLLAQGIGRWGNFTNQEVFGRNTDLPWGMWSQKTADFITANQAELAAKGIQVTAGTMADKAYVHPTFLYESIWCLLGFVLLFIVTKKFRKFSGQIMLSYGVWYGAGRAVIETFRLDGIPVAGLGLTLNQLRSIGIAVISAVALGILLNKYIKNPKPIEGIDFFPPNDPPKKRRGKESLEEEEVVEVELPAEEVTENAEEPAVNEDEKTPEEEEPAADEDENAPEEEEPAQVE